MNVLMNMQKLHTPLATGVAGCQNMNSIRVTSVRHSLFSPLVNFMLVIHPN